MHASLHKPDFEPVVTVESLSFSWPLSAVPAIDNLHFEIRGGEYLAILGANGSGKSTLLKLILGLIPPRSGRVLVRSVSGEQHDPSTEEGARAVRSIIATVLQNPDDQIVGTVVEEDVAFGPENQGLPPSEVAARVDAALATCGLSRFRTRPPHFLSGGERQRLCIASALALESPILALDEAASMIDPAGRRELLDLLDRLSAQGRTILHVTHSLEEAARAQRLVVLARGHIVFDGDLAGLLAHSGLESWGFALPEAAATARLLSPGLPGLDPADLSPRSFADSLGERLRSLPDRPSADGGHPSAGSPNEGHPSPSPDASVDSPVGGRVALDFRGAAHEYLSDTAFSAKAFSAVNLRVPEGSSLALIGSTGSGKTSLLRHGNAVLLPTEGIVRVFGEDTGDRKTDLAALRRKASLAVQQPESALFEACVADDVAWGPRNAGVAGSELEATVREAMAGVALAWEEFRDRDTRSLSGGEKRKAALAGVLAMKSPLVLLDEPTAALDGASRERLISGLLATPGRTLVITTHTMEEAARFSLVAVMRSGTLVAVGQPRAIFGARWSPSWGLERPWAAEVSALLAGQGLLLPFTPLNAAELAEAVSLWMAGGAPVFTEPPATQQLFASLVGEAPAELPSRHRRRTSGIEFFRNATLGQYLDRPSILRLLPASLKLLAVLLLSLPLFLFPSLPVSLAVLGFTLLTGAAFARVGPHHLLRGLIPAIPFIILMVVVQIVFSWKGDSSPILLDLNIVSLSLAELLRSILLVSNLCAFMALLSLFSATTRLSDAQRTLTRLFSPLARLGLPVRSFSVAFGIALRFVPVLVEEAERISIAQLSRGGGYAGRGKLRSAMALTVPLFIRSLERAENLALAMELRLFGGR